MQNMQQLKVLKQFIGKKAILFILSSLFGRQEHSKNLTAKPINHHNVYGKK